MIVYGPGAVPDSVKMSAAVLSSFIRSVYVRPWQSVSILFATSTESVTSVNVISAVAPFVTVRVVGLKTASLIVVVSQGSMIVTSNVIVSVSVKLWTEYSKSVVIVTEWVPTLVLSSETMSIYCGLAEFTVIGDPDWMVQVCVLVVV